MKRGTTPTIRINVTNGGVLSEYKTIVVTLKQLPNTVVEKTKDEVMIEDNAIEVMLSQEETLSFKPERPVLLQIRAVSIDGCATASNIIQIPIEKILKEGVL